MAEYSHVRTIAGKGSGPDQFESALRGIAVDPGDRVYAAGDSVVKVFDTGGALKNVLRTASTPLAVGVARSGFVFVGEAGGIEIFDARTGKLANTWSDDKLLGRVTAIDFLPNGEVLAGDASDRAIRRFDRTGQYLNTIGKDNSVNGLLIPNGVVDFGVDAEGVIHAANPGKHRVERYTPDGSLLGHIGKFGQLDPAGFPGCCNPTNVAVRGGGIFVTEKGGPRAKAYDFAGKLLGVIATKEFDTNCKNMSIAVDARGRVYVGDTVKLAIFVFAPKEARA